MTGALVIKALQVPPWGYAFEVEKKVANRPICLLAYRQ